VLYSVRLKHVVLLDVFIIASGFVLRILAGAVVVPVSISPWLYLVTILLSSSSHSIRDVTSSSY